MESPTSPQPTAQYRPRIGVPHRRTGEERADNWKEIQPYLDAVAEAGGEAIAISLLLSASERDSLCLHLDGFLLPGSPADVNPALYNEPRASATADPDPLREQIDFALLDDAFHSGKPVLGICYGAQLLNVYCGGSLVQDIPTELPAAGQHGWAKARGEPEPHHPVRLVPGAETARLAEASEAVVNSSHHQSVRKLGRGLRVTALSPDGVVEAVEWSAGGRWVIGVQWHPERERAAAEMGTRRLAQALFRQLVHAASEWKQAPQPEIAGMPAAYAAPRQAVRGLPHKAEER